MINTDLNNPDRNSSIVQTRNLCKSYQLGSLTLPVLRNINLDIHPGEYIVIMGPSGSGKSTLLNLLGCLDKPSTGTYLLGGRDVSDLNDDQLSQIRGSRIGFIFQSYNLIAQLNAMENIEVPMFYRGVSEKQSREKARDLACLVGLEERMKHRPAELSGGQQQRVAIARALINDPLLILADEPTGNLDSESGQEILILLDRLHQQGKTLLAVTHDEQVARRAQRIIHLSDGRIERIVNNHKPLSP